MRFLLRGNPADVYVSVLCGPHNVKPVRPERIDYEQINRWRARCAAGNLHVVLPASWRSTVAETLRAVAYAGGAQIWLRDGLWSVKFPE